MSYFYDQLVSSPWLKYVTAYDSTFFHASLFPVEVKVMHDNLQGVYTSTAEQCNSLVEQNYIFIIIKRNIVSWLAVITILALHMGFLLECHLFSVICFVCLFVCILVPLWLDHFGMLTQSCMFTTFYLEQSFSKYKVLPK